MTPLEQLATAGEMHAYATEVGQDSESSSQSLLFSKMLSDKPGFIMQSSQGIALYVATYEDAIALSKTQAPSNSSLGAFFVLAISFVFLIGLRFRRKISVLGGNNDDYTARD